MSKLIKQEIEYIEKVYRDVKSIQKTADITGFSTMTVNKYVKHISCLNPKSRDCKNTIYQIDLTTKEIIKEWEKPSIAAKELNINPAEITRVAKGELKQAGNFGWEYKFKK